MLSGKMKHLGLMPVLVYFMTSLVYIYIYNYIYIYITSGADIPLHIWYVQWMGCNGNIRNKSDGIIMLPVTYMFIRNLVGLFSPTSKCCSI